MKKLVTKAITCLTDSHDQIRFRELFDIFRSRPPNYAQQSLNTFKCYDVDDAIVLIEYKKLTLKILKKEKMKLRLKSMSYHQVPKKLNFGFGIKVEKILLVQ